MDGDRTDDAELGTPPSDGAPAAPAPVGFAPVDPRPAPAMPVPTARPLTWSSPPDPTWAPPSAPAPGWSPPDPATALTPAPPTTWYAWQPPAAPPPRSNVGRVVAGVAAGVLFFVVAAGGAGALLGGGGDDDAQVSASQAQLDAKLPELKAFVASSTGRTWVEEVSVELLSEEDFLDALDASGGSRNLPPSDDEDDIGATFEAMRLVPDAETFYETWNQHGTRSNPRWDADEDTDVVGFYDDRTGRIAVRGPIWDEFTEYTVVHELAHALQDQTFDLSSIDAGDRSDDESATVTTAVVEGDAELTARDYYDAQLPSWQYDFGDVDGSGASSDPDELVASTLTYFPYEAGPEFVRAVRDAGGHAAVDRLFTTRPKATRDIVAPQPWIAGQAPEVAQPSFPSPSPGTAGDVVDYGALGVLGLWVTAADTTPDLSTASALDGWRGDAYITTEIGGEICMTDVAVFADAASRTSARTYLAPWAKRSGGTVVDEGATGLRLRSCHR